MSHSNRKSLPRDHHYIPQFYTRQWAGEDEKLCEFQRPYKALVDKRKYPSATGYLRDLYRVEGVSEEICQSIELGFMRLTDQQAHLVHQQLLTEVGGSLEASSRSAWSRFLMSLMHRNPEKLGWLARGISAGLPSFLRQYEHDYASLRSDHDKPTFEEFADQMVASPTNDIVMQMMLKVCDSQRVGDFLNRMRWHAIRLQDWSLEFLTSDRPLAMTDGMAYERSHLMIPLSPKILFVAVNSSRYFEEIQAMQERKLVKYVNDTVASQAARFVYATNSRQIRFVENRLGRGKTQMIGAPADGSLQWFLDRGREIIRRADAMA
jgi:hypothetical protein